MSTGSNPFGPGYVPQLPPTPPTPPQSNAGLFAFFGTMAGGLILLVGVVAVIIVLTCGGCGLWFVGSAWQRIEDTDRKAKSFPSQPRQPSRNTR